MTIHYHGTPITPHDVLYSLAGRNFCVSHAHPAQVEIVHRIGQSILLDNGAFSAWKRGYVPDWKSYYAWCDRWLQFPTTYAIIPDVVDGGSQLQDALLKEWPYGDRGLPVWHMDEPLDRLLRLIDEWPKVCIGSTGDYAQVCSDAWHERMTEIWNGVEQRNPRRTPWLHMLRGMQLGNSIYPFASLDSTNIAQNHHLTTNSAPEMADRIDAMQCPGSWRRKRQALQLILGQLA